MYMDTRSTVRPKYIHTHTVHCHRVYAPARLTRSSAHPLSVHCAPLRRVDGGGRRGGAEEARRGPEATAERQRRHAGVHCAAELGLHSILHAIRTTLTLLTLLTTRTTRTTRTIPGR